jgi:ferric-dicitrate binding protein FerR (iron transport regulator)
MTNTPQPDRDHEFARLLKLAGERDVPHPDRMERARAAAHASWQRDVKTALALYFGIGRPSLPTVIVAHVVATEGNASVLASKDDPIAAMQDLPVHAGSELATRDGRVALTLGDSLSLRLDRKTRVRFVDASHVTLLEGAAYVDSGGLNAAPFLRIATPAGEVRHVGTQFLVVVDGRNTDVSVREGRVIVSRPDAGNGEIDIAAGEVLKVDATHAVLTRGLPSYGPQWEWVTAIAPPFDIENRPLSEFIAWVVREQGWQLRYADHQLQQGARDIRLHGSIDSMPIESRLETVSLITGVPLQVRQGELLVGRP